MKDIRESCDNMMKEIAREELDGLSPEELREVLREFGEVRSLPALAHYVVAGYLREEAERKLEDYNGKD